MASPETIDGSGGVAGRARLQRAKFAIGIAVVTVLAFLPALRGEFLNWDDNVLFTENPSYRGLGVAQLKWMFTHAVLAHYQPVTWMTHGLDYCLWGMNPLGYHLTSILWHAGNAIVLFYLVLRLLRLALPGSPNPVTHDSQAMRKRLTQSAALAALIFAVHPLRVESVAWITERRDVVSLFFLLVGTGAYLQFATNRENRAVWYVAALGFYIVSMLSKVWGLTWPLVLLVLDAYPLRRLTATENRAQTRFAALAVRIVEKIPFAAVAYVLGRYSYQLQSAYGIISSEPQPPIERLAKSCYALWFYLEKSIWPLGLGPVYEVPIPFNVMAPRFVFAMAAVLLLAFGAMILMWRRPAVAVALILYAIIVSPTLGLVSSSLALAADRYTYVATIPLAVLIGAGWIGWSSHRPVPGFLRAAPLIGVVLLAGLTWRQCGFWRSSDSLWQRALQIDPTSWNAHNNLGALNMQRGNDLAAADHFRQALHRLPGNARCTMNLANSLVRLGRPDDALKVLREAVAPDSKDVSIQCALVLRLLDLNDLPTAQSLATSLVAAQPDDPFAHFAQAFTEARAGHRLAAGDSFSRGIEKVEARVGEPRRVKLLGPEGVSYYRAGCKHLSVLYLEKGDAVRSRLYEEKWVKSAG